MPLPSSLKNSIYRQSIRLRVPFWFTSGAVRLTETLMSGADYLNRQIEANAMVGGTSWVGYVPRKSGYRVTEPDDIPGTDRIVALCREIVEKRRTKARKINRKEANPFDMLLDREVFAEHPELVEYATSDVLTAIASDYFGCVPRLDYIDLWVSSPEKNQDDLFNSQLYHMDRMDYGILTLFVAIEDIGPENGPFTLLPASVTRTVNRKTNYLKRYFLGNGRLRDEEVLSACDPKDAIEIKGPAGSGGFCDTGACLHFGSRCQTRERVVLAIRYYPAHRSVPSVYRTFSEVLTPTATPQQLLLAK